MRETGFEPANGLTDRISYDTIISVFLSPAHIANPFLCKGFLTRL